MCNLNANIVLKIYLCYPYDMLINWLSKTDNQGTSFTGYNPTVWTSY